MPDLLLELFSEEVPARMQGQAAQDLERLVVGALSDRNLLFEAARAFSGPRRLALAISGLPPAQRDVIEERKGPRVTAPEKAIEGFLRSAGVTLDQCVKHDDGKGEFYVAQVCRPGRATKDVLAQVLPETIGRLPWPKSMRWPGARAGERWVRPLHAIVCTFDGEVVPFDFAGVVSGNRTFGHRFLAPAAIEVRRFDDYAQKLREAFVVLSAEERREIILHDLRQKAFALGLEWIEDPGLLEEVAALAEWPVVLIGRIDDDFMIVPAEILQTAMRAHQRYFSLRPTGDNAAPLANNFAFVANMIAKDGGAQIVAGNERVLRARLADAKFFWEQDRKRRLESRIVDLKRSVFHAKAGTMHDRAFRIALVAMVIAEMLGLDVAKAERAGLLAKADLATGIVGEFPELQGVMGFYYALHDGEDPDVAAAIGDHYRPLGPQDRVPTAPASVAVALADKIDALLSLWRAGEKPTGSKDPFGLRRSALGIIRIVLENRLRLPLSVPFHTVIAASRLHNESSWERRIADALSNRMLMQGIARDLSATVRHGLLQSGTDGVPPMERESVNEVLEFVADRLKVALRDKGTRHDLIDALFSLGGEDDLLRLVARVEALGDFLKSADGANLLAGYRRAANILRIEEKRDGLTYEGEPDPSLLSEGEEIALFTESAAARDLIAAEMSRERFTEAMTVMARLRAPVDAFFEKVTVNAPDAALRRNRLLLLSRLRACLHEVADFSRIEG